MIAGSGTCVCMNFESVSSAVSMHSNCVIAICVVSVLVFVEAWVSWTRWLLSRGDVRLNGVVTKCARVNVCDVNTSLNGNTVSIAAAASVVSLGIDGFPQDTCRRWHPDVGEV